jgi:hypothetical protein
VAGQAFLQQRNRVLAGRVDALDVGRDALIEVGEVALRLAGRAQSGFALRPEKLHLLDVLFEEVGEVGQAWGGRGHGGLS